GIHEDPGGGIEGDGVTSAGNRPSDQVIGTVVDEDAAAAIEQGQWSRLYTSGGLNTDEIAGHHIAACAAQAERVVRLWRRGTSPSGRRRGFERRRPAGDAP